MLAAVHEKTKTIWIRLAGIRGIRSAQKVESVRSQLQKKKHKKQIRPNKNDDGGDDELASGTKLIYQRNMNK